MEKEQVGRGAILGALVGDAAGATLEFLPQTPIRSQVKQAMAMVGGGCWRTAPGQITDDGEMAICLMHALAGEDSFPSSWSPRATCVGTSLCPLISAVPQVPVSPEDCANPKGLFIEGCGRQQNNTTGDLRPMEA